MKIQLIISNWFILPSSLFKEVYQKVGRIFSLYLYETYAEVALVPKASKVAVLYLGKLLDRQKVCIRRRHLLSICALGISYLLATNL